MELSRYIGVMSAGEEGATGTRVRKKRVRNQSSLTNFGWAKTLCKTAFTILRSDAGILACLLGTQTSRVQLGLESEPACHRNYIRAIMGFV